MYSRHAQTFHILHPHHRINASAVAHTAASLSSSVLTPTSTSSPPTANPSPLNKDKSKLPSPSSTFLALSTCVRIAAVSVLVRSKWSCIISIADSRA